MAKSTKKIELHHISMERFTAGNSVNHQFPQLRSIVYSAYQKVVTHIVAFPRLHPADHSQVLSVLLQSNEKDFDFQTKTLTFNYANDVIELYSEAEDAYILSQNKGLFDRGILIPYTTYRAESANVTIAPVQASDLDALVNLPSSQFVEALGKITALATLQRVQRTLTEDHSQGKHVAVAKRIASLA